MDSVEKGDSVEETGVGSGSVKGWKLLEEWKLLEKFVTLSCSR